MFNINTIGLIAIGYIAAMVTVLVFRKPPATTVGEADEKQIAEIIAQVDRMIEDTKSTV